MVQQLISFQIMSTQKSKINNKKDLNFKLIQMVLQNKIFVKSIWLIWDSSDFLNNFLCSFSISLARQIEKITKKI